MDIGETTRPFQFEPIETDTPAPAEPAAPEPAPAEPAPALEPQPA